MERDDDQRQLLREICDTLKEQLAEYRRVTSQSLEIQQRSFEFQQRAVGIGKQSGRLAKVISVIWLFLVIGGVWFVIYIWGFLNRVETQQRTPRPPVAPGGWPDGHGRDALN